VIVEAVPEELHELHIGRRPALAGILGGEFVSGFVDLHQDHIARELKQRHGEPESLVGLVRIVPRDQRLAGDVEACAPGRNGQHQPSRLRRKLCDDAMSLADLGSIGATVDHDHIGELSRFLEPIYRIAGHLLQVPGHTFALEPCADPSDVCRLLLAGGDKRGDLPGSSIVIRQNERRNDHVEARQVTRHGSCQIERDLQTAFLSIVVVEE
jgi:hypothetical protein